MTPLHYQILETVLLLLLLTATKFIIRSILLKIDKKVHFALERKRIAHKIINLFLIMIVVVGLVAIWSVDPKQIFFYLTSILTLLGVGFIAQWSILSNITASLILFFNHPVHIGGRIKILDKDFPIEGSVENITMFFMYIRTNDGEILSIPNNIVMQKTLSVEPKQLPKN